MKSILMLLLSSMTLITEAQINGTVKDDNGSPLTGTTVSLLKAADSTVLKLAVSKENGTYSFSEIKEGNYRISASHIGYKTIFSASFSFAAAQITIPELKLIKEGNALANVTVT